MGAAGQVGHEIVRQARARHEVTPLDRHQLDITRGDLVHEAIQRLQPGVVFNGAAYTAVDRAESEPERAYAVNRDGAAHLAEACEALAIPLIHLSTDYVFDGEKSTAYVETDTPNPLNVYGASKLAGEQMALHRCSRTWVFRLSWVFGPQGNNFVKTMLRLAAEREELRVVNDQFGAPMPAVEIARVLIEQAEAWQAGTSLPWGIHHFTSEPGCTWFHFAGEIFRQAVERGLLEKVPRLVPIPSSDYPTPARRPRNSRLGGGFGVTLDWKSHLF